jgi:fumarate reductase flavoprotein subunit/NADH-quinone oxidoreductase subunit F
LTEKDCIVAETEKKLLETRRQSCGKCVFCREGLIQLAYMQKEITEGRGKMEYLDLTKEIGEAMCDSTPCSMGQTCAKIALTAIDRFADEYEAHIKKKNCPAGVCSAFVAMYIDPQSCNGCGDCVDVCPLDCIEGKSGYIHMIDEFDCSKCGKCMEVCEEGAIHKTTGKVPKLPNRLTKVGKFRKR